MRPTSARGSATAGKPTSARGSATAGKRLVVDASVLAAVVFGEPEGPAWSRRLEGAAVFAPRLLQYELQSVALKKCRRHPQLAARIVTAVSLVLCPESAITWIDPDPADVVPLANATGLTAYDASYVCVAGLLEAELATADQRLSAAVDPSAE